MDVIQIRVADIARSPHQMRNNFFVEEIVELASSIESVGLLQPLVVRQRGDKYELISGERRLRAVISLGWETVPASVMPMEESRSALSCLIENIQRVDLNPIEIATSCSKLLRDFSLTQEELALRVGKKRSSIANYLRILNLPAEIQQAIAQGQISFGHAKVILALPSRDQQIALFERVIKEGLSVREIEKCVKEKPVQKKEITVKGEQLDLFLNEFRDKLMYKFGTKVTYRGGGKSGCWEIHWDSPESLDALLQKLGVSDEF